jgi:ATP-dependent protease ClpP protease subunit
MADKKPYGDVEYADPGYQSDGKKRYPIDTEAHCRAAWSYINQRKNADKYSPEQVSHIKTAIRKAGKKFGIEFEDRIAQPVGKHSIGSGGTSWYSISNSAEAPEVYIYDEIGMFGVTAGAFINDLNNLKAASITLRLNSGGGDVFEGIAIMNALRNHPAKVTAFIDGVAASIASVIAMAGDHVEMSPNSSMMIHDASSAVMGNAKDMHAMADLLDKTSNNIASVYAEKTGGQPEDWRHLMQATTWFDANEAVDAGLADAVTQRPGNAAPAVIANKAAESQVEQEDEIDWDAFASTLKGAFDA